MSSSHLAKKLLPAKKAWKGFNIKFQSKFQKLIRTKHRCSHIFSRARVFILQKLHALTTRKPQPRHHFHCHHHQRYMGKTTSSAIYVDELFPGRVSLHNADSDQQYQSLAQPRVQAKPTGMAASSSSAGNGATGGTPSNNLEKQHRRITGVKNFERKDDLPSKSSPAKIPMLPQFRCVDERAEEFISKVRLGMKLEREQSIIDYQEMLARSV